MEEEWNQTNLNLQTAREQIGDLNLQVTILTSGKKKNKRHTLETSIFTQMYEFNVVYY